LLHIASFKGRRQIKVYIETFDNGFIFHLCSECDCVKGGLD
jgi:hypothetical protein